MSTQNPQGSISGSRPQASLSREGDPGEGLGTGGPVLEFPHVPCRVPAAPALSPGPWRPRRAPSTPTSSAKQPKRAGSGHPRVTIMSEHRGARRLRAGRALGQAPAT